MEHVIDSKARAAIGLGSMLVGAICLVASIPGQAGAQGGGPPGNNGTVKIDGEDFDDHPDNEPHVGCVFQVDFYGFDEGDLFADVIFAVQPPTGNEVILEDADIFIGEDDNSGGGSEEGLDASRTYDLTDALAAFEPHPEQGWHVKLTVHADGSQGADVKHKVFWVTGCETPPPSTTTTTESTTTTTEADDHDRVDDDDHRADDHDRVDDDDHRADDHDRVDDDDHRADDHDRVDDDDHRADDHDRVDDDDHRADDHDRVDDHDGVHEHDRVDDHDQRSDDDHNRGCRQPRPRPSPPHRSARFRRLAATATAFSSPPASRCSSVGPHWPPARSSASNRSPDVRLHPKRRWPGPPGHRLASTPGST